MTTSLRVLTYNVQLRSWGMEVLAQKSLTPYTSVELRATIIADRILRSPQQYDVVCLQEVFDEDGREILTQLLGPSYPWSVTKADAGKLALGTGRAGGSVLVPSLDWVAGLGAVLEFRSISWS
jgi:hypothetical protein